MTTKTYRNPRRAALAQLKTIKDRLQWCLNGWTVSSTVYEDVRKTYTGTDPNMPRVYTDSVTRKRRPEEYPENQADRWATLFNQASQAAREAEALAEFAREQYRRCLVENQS